MSKPKKHRRVQYPPSVVYFKPQGIPMFQLEQITLAVDEYEAVRLVDREGLDQEQAAERMGVSRATCARILDSAHKKIAEALTQGKAIRIEGGNFTLRLNRYRCLDCGTVWEQDLDGAEQTGQNATPTCPNCKSTRVLDFARQAGWRPATPWTAEKRHGGESGGFEKGRGGGLWSS